MQRASPNIYMIAGPNGAGKTTFAEQFLPSFVECREFLNADLIAAGLSPFRNPIFAVAMIEELQISSISIYLW
jgi:predicted ABC-type ATPase